MVQQTHVKSIKWHELFKSITDIKADHINQLEVEREVIPVIFVPGIMGSRLKNAQGKKVWDPSAKFFMLRKYGMFYVEPEERKQLLVGASFQQDYLAVMNDDATHNKKLKAYTGAEQRGWGGISWDSYGKCLQQLQKQAFSEPIQQCFEFPVHAFGYNWTASNDDSGKALSDYINATIAQYQDVGRYCEKVILVTHSMGGLVARSACCLHGAESKVLGVLHGVQPATGSPAAYWRMKAGWERPEGSPADKSWPWLRNPIKMLKHTFGGYTAAWVLGTNGEEVTSLLANMPGGLELLPTKDYVDNEGNHQWLRYIDSDGNEQALPKNDPYDEIYLARDVFYRLVDPEWLGGDLELSEFDSDTPWDSYTQNLKRALKFHGQLEKQVHSETFQFYSKGLKTADKIIYHCEVHTWGAKAKRMFKILKDAIPGKAATTAGGGVVKAAFGMPAFTSSGLAVSGALTLVTTAYKDSDTNVNRGGFREYVNDSGLVVKTLALKEDDWVELEEEKFDAVIDIDPESETVWLYSLQYPDGSGDGTVPDSSSTALDVGVSGWGNDDDEDLDAFGVPVDDSSAAHENLGTTVGIGSKEESEFNRGHEPIYKTKTGQHIVFAAIENFCLLKIREHIE